LAGESSTKKQRIRVNNLIIAPQVRLVDPELILKTGKIGIMSVQEALGIAEAHGNDLVEVSPNAVPPVVRVMDFGKFIFDAKKKGKGNQKKQRVQKIKELKLRPVTDDGDYRIKLRSLIAFLEKGDKVKITIRFRGREMAHQELSTNLIEKLKVDIEDYGQIEQMPRAEGRQIVMMIAPKTAADRIKKKNQDESEET
jgi:translation initiation factor IF-3